MEYAHKLHKLVVGKKYLVAHAELYNTIINTTEFLPIIPNLHSDNEFSEEAKLPHYHIDGRFGMTKALRESFRVRGGYTNNILCLDYNTKEYQYDFKGLVFKEKTCLREQTGIKPPFSIMPSNNSYNVWYDGMIGKSCAGKRCPHYGANMIEVDGKLVCPLHDLHGDPEKLVIIQHPKRVQHPSI